MSKTVKQPMIDIDIPLPPARSNVRWPIKQLEVKESFPIPAEKRKLVSSIVARVQNETGRKFTIRQIRNPQTGKMEVRCWRLK